MTIEHRILIVDAQHAAPFAIGRHVIRAAFDASGAVEVCKDFVPHVAIVDMSISRDRGASLANKLRVHMDAGALIVGVAPDPTPLAYALAFDRVYARPLDLGNVDALIARWFVRERTHSR